MDVSLLMTVSVAGAVRFAFLDFGGVDAVVVLLLLWSLRRVVPVVAD